MGMRNNNVVNVTSTSISGLKVVIAAPKTKSFSLLFKNYVNKVDLLGTKIRFTRTNFFFFQIFQCKC